MKKYIYTMVTVLGITALLDAGAALAAGYGKGGGQQMQSQHNNQSQSQYRQQHRNQTQSSTGSSSEMRPADSQRRDGTYLTTGTTANGSTVRPGNGNGLQDGTRLNTTTAQ